METMIKFLNFNRHHCSELENLLTQFADKPNEKPYIFSLALTPVLTLDYANQAIFLDKLLWAIYPMYIIKDCALSGSISVDSDK